jgi:hypothetical protein
MEEWKVPEMWRQRGGRGRRDSSNMKKAVHFQPKARVCWECPKLEKMREKQSGQFISGQKLCTQFGWEILDKLAQKQAVCSCPREVRHRQKKA